MSEKRGEYRVPAAPCAFKPRPETLLEYSDPGYEPPTKEEVKAALLAGGLTGSQAGQLLGVSSRTVRKWTGGDQGMQYSAWRLLLIALGQVKAPRRLKPPAEDA